MILRRITIASLFGLLLLYSPLYATAGAEQQTPQAKQATLAALDFLERCDQQDYAASWSQSARLFREKTDQDAWLKQISHLRGQYGELLGRTLQLSKAIETEQTEQELLFLIFRSSFARKTAAEMLTMSKENGQPWRVAGYSIQ